jgi:hypothetical protein
MPVTLAVLASGGFLICDQGSSGVTWKVSKETPMVDSSFSRQQKKLSKRPYLTIGAGGPTWLMKISEIRLLSWCEPILSDIEGVSRVSGPAYDHASPRT